MRSRYVILTLSIMIFGFTGLRAQLPEEYTTYNEALQILTDIQAGHESICKLDTMGYSTRDNVPMLRFKISDNAAIDEDEPAVFLCGGVHADEVLGVEVVMNFIQDLITLYDEEDLDAYRYISNLEIFCVPFINPEGHTVVEGGNTDWRKNKCDNDGNEIFDFHDGVDNNRNYDFGWSIDNENGANVPESLMFKGTAPFTQTENIAMAEFGQRYHPLIAIDYHSPSYGRPNVAYYPWYWYPNQGGNGFSPDESLMLQICTAFTNLIDAIPDDSNTVHYTARRALVNKGDMKTYFYGNFGTAAFSVEISDTTIQDPALITPIVDAHLPGQYYLLERALGPGIAGVITDSITLEPLEAEVQVTQHINADINPRMSRPDYGRYNRLLAPGSYTLRFIKDGYITRTLNNVVVGSSGPTINDVALVPLNPRPPAPQPINPIDNFVFEENPVQFDWNPSLYADFYLLEIAYDPDFTDMVFSDSSIADTALTMETPLADSGYYWRIKGGNSNGWGPYAQTRFFSVNTQTGVEDNQSRPISFKLLSAYPNPFNASTSIEFSLDSESPVEISIFDVMGRRVETVFDGVMTAGDHSVVWKADRYSSGIYFARLTDGKKSDSVRMVLLK